MKYKFKWSIFKCLLSIWGFISVGLTQSGDLHLVYSVELIVCSSASLTAAKSTTDKGFFALIYCLVGSAAWVAQNNEPPPTTSCKTHKAVINTESSLTIKQALTVLFPFHLISTLIDTQKLDQRYHYRRKMLFFFCSSFPHSNEKPFGLEQISRDKSVTGWQHAYIHLPPGNPLHRWVLRVKIDPFWTTSIHSNKEQPRPERASQSYGVKTG